MEPFDDQTDLIRALFATSGQSATAEWAEFLALLCKVTQADSACLILDGRNRTRSWCEGRPYDLDLAARQSLRFDRVYSQESLAIPDGGALPVRFLKVRTILSASLSLSVVRNSFGRDFRSVDGQVLNGLAPFLGQAMGLWLEREQQQLQTTVVEAMLAALGGAWMIFDSSARVLRFSKVMPVLQGRTGFFVEDGRPLRFLNPGFASEFQHAFARVVAGETPTVISLADGEMMLTRIEPDRASSVLGRLRLTPRTGTILPKAIARHFGISISEARLATLICDGYSLQAAATELGWTEQSTRTCSKALYGRLAVDGQPGVVRRIVNSSLWYSVS